MYSMYSVCSAFGLGSLFQLLIFYDLICLYHYTMAGCVISLPGRLDIYYGTPNIGSLPPRHLWIYEIGRHFPVLLLFVCRGWLNPADGHLVLPFLSAADGWSRQTDSLFCLFVCRDRPYPADGQMILPFLSACALKKAGPGLKNRGPCLLYWL